MVAEGLLLASWRRGALGLAAGLALVAGLAAPAAASEPPPAAGAHTTDSILKWINAYRSKPEPNGVPVLVHILSDTQAFKDAETSGAYVGFIAGVSAPIPTAPRRS